VKVSARFHYLITKLSGRQPFGSSVFWSLPGLAKHVNLGRCRGRTIGEAHLPDRVGTPNAV
jgi:hypothetical protein